MCKSQPNKKTVEVVASRKDQELCCWLNSKEERRQQGDRLYRFYFLLD